MPILDLLHKRSSYTQQLLEEYRSRKKLKKLKKMKKQKSGEEDLINGETGTPELGNGGRDNAGFEGDGGEVERGEL